MSSPFAEIAPRYDSLRPLRPPDQARLEAMLAAAASPSPTLSDRDLIVEVGCGTGRLTIPLAGLTPARVVGVDPEARMLEVARAKDADRRIEWRPGTAYRLPVARDQATLVLMAMVVHLLKQRTRAFREARRILKPAGQLSLWTFTQQDIRDFYLNGYFPSIPLIDLARFPDHRTIESELIRAGFETVTTKIEREQGEISLAEVVDRVRGRYISTLALLPPLEYRLGLQQLEEQLAAAPATTLTQRLEWAIVTATKSAAGSAAIEA